MLIKIPAMTLLFSSLLLLVSCKKEFKDMTPEEQRQYEIKNACVGHVVESIVVNKKPSPFRVKNRGKTWALVWSSTRLESDIHQAVWDVYNQKVKNDKNKSIKEFGGVRKPTLADLYEDWGRSGGHKTEYEDAILAVVDNSEKVFLKSCSEFYQSKESECDKSHPPREVFGCRNQVNSSFSRAIEGYLQEGSSNGNLDMVNIGKVVSLAHEQFEVFRTSSGDRR